MKPKLLVIVTLLAVTLFGCKPNDFLRNTTNRMAPDDDEALAMECLTALRARDFETVIGQLDQQVVKPGIESKMLPVADMLTQGEPLSVELVGCRIFSTPDKRRSNLTYQYHFTNAWILATITIDTVGENKKVFSVSVNPIPKSLGELNAFTLAGKSIRHYVLFSLALIIPVFIIWTIILCARTKIRKKWLWIIFILIGITSLNLNWTTGQMGFQPIAFEIPGVGMVKMGLYAPWILKVSFPLGAILFLIKRRRLQSKANNETINIEPQATTVPAPEQSQDIH